MKTIGMLGGMSWESTVPYYQIINRYIQQQLGGLHSARIVLHSVNFAEVEQLQHTGQWDKAGDLLAEAAVGLEHAGADFLIICTNTMHKVAHQIQERLTIPLLHIADPTAQALVEAGFKRVALLGTAFTMEQNFYKQRLVEQYGLEVMIPDERQRKQVHQIIYDELCQGKINEDSRRTYVQIAESLAEQGAEAIILGCTEISLLLTPEYTSIPLFDTTRLHAEAAAVNALQDK